MNCSTLQLCPLGSIISFLSSFQCTDDNSSTVSNVLGDFKDVTKLINSRGSVIGIDYQPPTPAPVQHVIGDEEEDTAAVGTGNTNGGSSHGGQMQPPPPGGHGDRSAAASSAAAGMAAGYPGKPQRRPPPTIPVFFRNCRRERLSALMLLPPVLRRCRRGRRVR